MSKRSIVLPKIMLGADTRRVLQILQHARDLAAENDIVHIDAIDLEMAEPLPMCLLGCLLHDIRRIGGTASVENLRQEVAERLKRMDVLSEWLSTRKHTKYSSESVYTLQARIVTSIEDADATANALAEAIATFAPPEYSQDGSITRDGVSVPLGYIFTELLDNAMTHGRGKGFGHAAAFVAAQYYQHGDLIRLAVVDNGCGFLKSLESHKAMHDKSHATAIRTAFVPGVSCNKDVGLFTDSLNAGLGLTVSRDIAIMTEGSVAGGSGDAWLNQPGLEKKEMATRIPFWQGSMLNLELHRRGLVAMNFWRLFDKYHKSNERLNIRFL